VASSFASKCPPSLWATFPTIFQNNYLENISIFTLNLMKNTSMTYVVGPSVNTFFIFTFSKLIISKFGDVNTLKAQLILPSKPIFCNLFEFSPTKSTQNQYFSHLSSKNCEIKSLNLTH
jgi:hypothetical protein